MPPKRATKPGATDGDGKDVSQDTGSSFTVWPISELRDILESFTKKDEIRAWAQTHGCELSDANLTLLLLRQTLIGQLCIDRRVRMDATPEDSASAPVARIEAKLDAVLTEFHKQSKTISDLRESLEYTQEEVDGLQKTVKQMQKQLGDLAGQLSAHKAAKPADAVDQDSIVMAGLAEDTPDVEQQVQSIFKEHMEIEMDVQIVKVSRIGSVRSDDAQPQMPRKLLIQLGEVKQARAVLKAASTLKAYNAAAKESGRRPIGLDRNLSFEERLYRSSLWSNFKAAREEGKKTYWSGHRLFINGAEVFPVAVPKSTGG